MKSERKIRICYVIDKLGVGGAERLTIETINFLNKELFDVSLVYLLRNKDDGDLLHLLNPGINVRYFDLEKYKFFERIYELSKAISGFDIVHSCLENSNLFCGLAKFLMRTNGKFISTIHGFDGIHIDDPNLRQFYSQMSYKHNVLHNQIQNFVFKPYEKFIAVSHYTKKYLIEFRNVDTSKIEVIYHGINLDSYSDSKLTDGSIKEKYGLLESDFVLGYVGRLSYAKGLEYMIDELKLIINVLPKIKLVIVGEGVLRKKLEALTIQNNIQNNVIFTGVVKNVQEHYKIFDYLILPSMSEGLNLSILESMYFGIPVIASDSGGPKEIITHSKDGLLFRTGDFAEMGKLIISAYNNEFDKPGIICEAEKTIRTRFDLKKNVEIIGKFLLEVHNAG